MGVLVLWLADASIRRPGCARAEPRAHSCRLRPL